MQHAIDLSQPFPSRNEALFRLGTAINPQGTKIAADGVSLFEGSRRIAPVMGELHYSRLPRAEWRDALLKMKAGGIDVVASYVFWIHHEEVAGQWDWTGERDLRAFIQLCGECGFKCVVRMGPWCHGEVRNGGLPEWLFERGIECRTNNSRYLTESRRLYEQIAVQLKGLLWKDGGPVIGVQIENEYSGPAEHLLTLKQMAVEAGIDVPLYTRTGWPELQTPMPFGELLPLFGGYAEGFWDRLLESMPGPYWKEFVFKHVRTDAAIANEQFGTREAKDAPDIARYPYLTCEIGPGMPCSYHRRITVFPMDVLSMVMVKLGSGSNSPGYYMYHGGTNPAGREPWLQECQSSRLTNWNDLPVKSYDFQTALGEFGQVRPQYHLLRPVHLFLQQFGERLTPMRSVLPEGPIRKDDAATLRWAVRTDGHCGFVFVNNYQRLLPLPERTNATFNLRLQDGELTFPQRPTIIAADRAFCWPFNFDLGDGVVLRHATAQLVCQLREADTIYTVFSQTGNAAEFAFEDAAVPIQYPQSGTQPFIELAGRTGVRHRLILLDEAAVQSFYKLTLAGRERLVLTTSTLIPEADGLRLIRETGREAHVAILPAPQRVTVDGQPLAGSADGAWTRYALPAAMSTAVAPIVEQTKPHGPLRTIRLGQQGVAEQPVDADFEQAAVWQITLPAVPAGDRQGLLRIRYTGDVARAYAGDTLLTDNFYNGAPFEIGVNRFAGEIARHGITLKILPLQAGTPIHMLDSVRPALAAGAAVASLEGVELIESSEVRMTLG